MNLTHVTNHGSIINDICLASRMQEGFSGIRIVNFFLMHTDLVEELFYDTLHAEEVAIAIHAKSELHSLIR